MEGFHYDPSKYHCAYFKKATILGKVSIFGTGKMISVGAKKLADAQHDLEYAKNVLVESGLIKNVRLRVQLRNIVVIGDLQRTVDIAKFAISSDIVYDPEQFPAGIYHPEELEGACVLVFTSGKVVFSGIRRADYAESCEAVLRKLHQMG